MGKVGRLILTLQQQKTGILDDQVGFPPLAGDQVLLWILTPIPGDIPSAIFLAGIVDKFFFGLYGLCKRRLKFPVAHCEDRGRPENVF